MEALRYSSFVPWATMWMAFYSGTDEERHLKMASLLFDDVYLPVDGKALAGANAEFARKENLRHDEVSKVWHSVESIHSSFKGPDFADMLFRPPNEQVFHKGNWRRGLRGAIYADLAKYFKISQNELKDRLRIPKDPVERYEIVKEGNALANTGIGSALVWTLLRPYLDCAFFPFNEAEFAAANLILGGTNKGTLKAANLLLPNAGNLSWQEVFEIRCMPEAENFRRWLHSRDWVRFQNNSIEQDVIGALLDIVDDCRPNVGSELLKGIASNFPVPLPINPASVVLSLKAIGEAQRFNEKYDWSLFLRRAAGSAANAKSGPAVPSSAERRQEHRLS